MGRRDRCEQAFVTVTLVCVVHCCQSSDLLPASELRAALGHGSSHADPCAQPSLNIIVQESFMLFCRCWWWGAGGGGCWGPQFFASDRNFAIFRNVSCFFRDCFRLVHLVCLLVPFAVNVQPHDSALLLPNNNLQSCPRLKMSEWFLPLPQGHAAMCVCQCAAVIC